MNNVKPISFTVKGEGPFRYMGSTGRFIIQASSDSFTVNWSADGVTWTACEEATPASENTIVVNAVTGMYFKLVGNTKVVRIMY